MLPSLPEFSYYPTPEEIDAWIDELRNDAEHIACQAEILPAQEPPFQCGLFHGRGRFRYVKFTPEGMTPFFGWYMPALSQPAPLLVHTPGYGAEIALYPELSAMGFSIIHVNPLGYATPSGADNQKMDAALGWWPLLPDTILGKDRGTYREWLLDCIMAIRWCSKQPAIIPGRISFFGSSQGGGAALLLGSMYAGRGVRCVAADEPFLTNFPLAKTTSTFRMGFETLEKMTDQAGAWKRLGFVDTMSHVHRLNIPVLLTSGAADTVCPSATIESLFEKLPSTKAYHKIAGEEHAYTAAFPLMAGAWFRIHA